jgi:ABC-2 type transport system ATP-binding protein
VGPNGAGKTTTIKILVGLLRPSGGSALVCGHNVLEEPLEVKARVGFLPETGALFEKLSAREYLDLVGTLYGLEEERIRERSQHWLQSFRLLAQAEVPMTTFSRGTRQKVCWAAALLHDPEVLVLDEPLTGLDVETVSRVKDLLSRLAAEGKTVFYSSHMIDVVEKICTRVGVLHQGRLLACGSLDEVRELTGEWRGWWWVAASCWGAWWWASPCPSSWACDWPTPSGRATPEPGPLSQARVWSLAPRRRPHRKGDSSRAMLSRRRIGMERPSTSSSVTSRARALLAANRASSCFTSPAL